MYSPQGVVEEWERTNSEQFWRQLCSLSFARNHAMSVSHNILVSTQHIMNVSRNNHYLSRPGGEPGIFGCGFIFSDPCSAFDHSATAPLTLWLWNGIRVTKMSWVGNVDVVKVVEHTPHDQEIVGLNPAVWWAFYIIFLTLSLWSVYLNRPFEMVQHYLYFL